MLKIALVAAAAFAAVTTAYAIHQGGAEPSEPDAPEAPLFASAAAPAPEAPAGAPRQVPRLAAPAAVAPEPHEGRAPSPSAPLPAPPVDPATIERLGLHVGPARGPAGAPVTIVVFTDFMCSFCGVVLGTIDELWDEYPDKLRLVVKQFPVHEEAVLAAEAALAADAQDRFWPLHDLMLANQDDLSRPALVDYAREAGLDVAAFEEALDQRRFRDALTADQDAARELDIRGTPAFLINGARFVGARPLEQFRAAIDEALAAAGP